MLPHKNTWKTALCGYHTGNLTGDGNHSSLLQLHQQLWLWRLLGNKPLTHWTFFAFHLRGCTHICTFLLFKSSIRLAFNIVFQLITEIIVKKNKYNKNFAVDCFLTEIVLLMNFWCFSLTSFSILSILIVFFFLGRWVETRVPRETHMGIWGTCKPCSEIISTKIFLLWLY